MAGAFLITEDENALMINRRGAGEAGISVLGGQLGRTQYGLGEWRPGVALVTVGRAAIRKAKKGRSAGANITFCMTAPIGGSGWRSLGGYRRSAGTWSA